MSCEERHAFEEYVRLVEKCMNRDIDPTLDFMQYTTGRYRDEDFDRTKGESPPSYNGCGCVLKYILDNERITNPLIQKVRNFCRSKQTCLEGGLKEFLRSDQFSQFCGGLPVFNDNWSAENFNWAKAVGILFALQYDVILQLTMENLDDTKVIFISAYQFSDYIIESIDEVLQSLELEDDKLADIVNDLNIFKENFPEDIGENAFRRSGLELQDYSEIFDFSSFLETALCITINNHDIFHLGEGVVEYLSFLSRLDRKVLANYLTVIAFYKNFYQDIDNPIDWEQTKFFKPVLISSGFSTYYDYKEEKKLQYLKNRLNISYENDTDKYPENFREMNEEYFRENIDQTIQYIENNYSYSKILKEYKDLEISPDNFYQNLTNIRNHGVPKSAQKYSSIRGDDKEMTNSLTDFLKYVIVHWNKPMAFHFSGQEAANWRIIIARRYNHDDNFYNQYLKKSKELLSILESQIEGDEDMLYEFWPENVITSIEAIKIVYNDYKVWMRENETVVRWQDQILLKINLNSDKLFFVAFVQNLSCSIAYDRTTAFLTFLNCEDFVKVFKCGPDSPMNPRKFL